jgi:hypothetical protein
MGRRPTIESQDDEVKVRCDMIDFMESLYQARHQGFKAPWVST